MALKKLQLSILMKFDELFWKFQNCVVFVCQIWYRVTHSQKFLKEDMEKILGKKETDKNRLHLSCFFKK